MWIQSWLSTVFNQAFQQAFPDEAANVPEWRWERPRTAAHGDYAVNVASLAKVLKIAPPVIAAKLATELSNVTSQVPTQLPSQALDQVSTALTTDNTPGFTVDIIGAFINITLTPYWLALAWQQMLATAPNALGHNTHRQGQVISLEYVSANPTGPLHIGHGRWAALGDSIHRLLEACGAQVRAEFYINDAGGQMNNLARSLWWRCYIARNPGVAFPPRPSAPDAVYPYYPGDYLIPTAKAFLADYPTAFDAAGEAPDEQSPLFEQLKTYARQFMLQHQQQTLAQMDVRFDRWLSEMDLYASGAVADTLAKVQQVPQATFEEDGALWLNTMAHGDEKNRVLRKQDGSFTYLTPDIACHLNKWHYKPDNADLPSPQVTQMINIWGADHHGYIARLQAALKLVQLPDNALTIVLGQLVNLVIDGEKTRMGKRRKMLTLQDLIDEVGGDATRFWMVSKSADTALDFDVDMATRHTNENPVYYAQYAHARCCSLIKLGTEPRLDRDSGESLPPLIDPKDWQAFVNQQRQLQAINALPSLALWSALDTPEAVAAVKALIMRLDLFDSVVKDAGNLLAPHLLARYILDLAGDFHHWYACCRIITPTAEVTRWRLLLVYTVQNCLAAALGLLGVSAPQQM
jgi:arginyl-tRNA synthetase